MDLLDRYGLRPSRALGQHFVADANTVRRIARLAGVGPGDRVVEVGPGLGSLTLALAETGASVTAIEFDRHVITALAEVVAGHDVRIVHGDAMTLDWSSVLGDEQGWALVANLPYNVATPLVIELLEGVPIVARMLVMVQREAGERLAAGVGDTGYGAVSVKVAYWARASIVGRVPATVFVPPPKVESVLVAIERRSAPAVDPGLVAYDQLAGLVRRGFGQRRKMLRRSLAGVVADDVFAAAGVRPESRPEELDIDAWGRLAACTWPSPSGPAPS